jgi:hypothetical protein
MPANLVGALDTIMNNYDSHATRTPVYVSHCLVAWTT